MYWVRDSALTYQYLFRLYQGGNSSLKAFFFEYARETRKLQHLNTLSGDFETGGIGEPKYRSSFNTSWLISRFYMNGTAYLGSKTPFGDQANLVVVGVVPKQ